MTVPFFFELRASSVLCVVFRSSEGRSKAGLDEREEPLQCWECKVDWYQYSLQIVQHTFLFSNQFYILSSTETMKFVTYLFAFLSVANIALAADDKECEVCVKVMDDIRNSMAKEDMKSKPKIEKAMGEYCANTDDSLSAREKKICYYIDPIKRDIAQPFSLGMTSLKVCKRITKSNPEICTVKFPIKTEKLEKKDLSKLRVKQLKAILSQRGVECKGCIEKDEFIKKVQDTEHLSGDEF